MPSYSTLPVALLGPLAPFSLSQSHAPPSSDYPCKTLLGETSGHSARYQKHPMGFQQNIRQASYAHDSRLFSHLFDDSPFLGFDKIPLPRIGRYNPFNALIGPDEKDQANKPPDTVKDPFSTLLKEVPDTPPPDKLELPEWLNQLLGLTDQHSQIQIIDELSLQAPWDEHLERDTIMSLLQVGMITRYCYQKLVPEKNPDYCKQFENVLTTAGYQLKPLSTDNALWGLIAHRKNEVLIGFRGTYYWEDMWRNLQFLPTMTNDELPDDEQTHYGMSLVFEKLWPEIQNQLTQIATQNKASLNIRIAGHSLGGSMAKLAALRLQKQAQINTKLKSINIDTVCTFGAPKTLSASSAKHYRQLDLNKKTITISHHRDIVPQLPPNWLNWLALYEPVGQQLYLSRKGSIWLMPSEECIEKDQAPETIQEDKHDNDQRQRWLTDHALESYLLILHIHGNAKIPPPLPQGQCPMALSILKLSDQITPDRTESDT